MAAAHQAPSTPAYPPNPRQGTWSSPKQPSPHNPEGPHRRDTRGRERDEKVEDRKRAKRPKAEPIRRQKEGQSTTKTNEVEIGKDRIAKVSLPKWENETLRAHRESSAEADRSDTTRKGSSEEGGEG